MAGKDRTKGRQGSKAQQRPDSAAQQPGKSPDSMQGSNAQKVQGEGDYEAARKFNEAEERFIESGGADEGARQAAPRTDQEARELAQAEEEARRHSKGEDSTLKPGKSTK